jgi:hypothetical protein
MTLACPAKGASIAPLLCPRQYPALRIEVLVSHYCSSLRIAERVRARVIRVQGPFGSRSSSRPHRRMCRCATPFVREGTASEGGRVLCLVEHLAIPIQSYSRWLSRPRTAACVARCPRRRLNPRSYERHAHTGADISNVGYWRGRCPRLNAGQRAAAGRGVVRSGRLP